MAALDVLAIIRIVRFSCLVTFRRGTANPKSRWQLAKIQKKTQFISLLKPPFTIIFALLPDPLPDVQTPWLLCLLYQKGSNVFNVPPQQNASGLQPPAARPPLRRRGGLHFDKSCLSGRIHSRIHVTPTHGEGFSISEPPTV